MSLDLMKAITLDIDYKDVVSALDALGNATEGPLRITVTDGVPILGVRTWTQFFDEYFFEDHLYREAREKETARTLEKYIPKLLDLNSLVDDNDATERPKSDPMKDAILRLRATVNGVDLNPKLGALGVFVDLVRATTMPTYKNGETLSATVKSFRGRVLIPQGLSMGTVPIKKVIADRHFGHSSATTGKNASEGDYFNSCKNILAKVKNSERHVAIKLIPRKGFKISDAHRNGAWRAASEFIATRKAEGNPASVLLCLDEMPKAKSKPLNVLPIKNAGITKTVASNSSSSINAPKRQTEAGQTNNSVLVDTESDDESET